MIKRQMALEINTSGFRQSPGRTYPDQELVRLYRELGGKMISIGSDAHRADDLGSGCWQALSMAQKIGFDRVVSFERRQMQWIEIPETKENGIG
jgi:histidinol-phosphatase (PHP family)